MLPGYSSSCPASVAVAVAVPAPTAAAAADVSAGAATAAAWESHLRAANHVAAFSEFVLFPSLTLSRNMVKILRRDRSAGYFWLLKIGLSSLLVNFLKIRENYFTSACFEFTVRKSHPIFQSIWIYF